MFWWPNMSPTHNMELVLGGYCTQHDCNLNLPPPPPMEEGAGLKSPPSLGSKKEMGDSYKVLNRPRLPN